MKILAKSLNPRVGFTHCREVHDEREDDDGHASHDPLHVVCHAACLHAVHAHLKEKHIGSDKTGN